MTPTPRLAPPLHSPANLFFGLARTDPHWAEQEPPSKVWTWFWYGLVFAALMLALWIGLGVVAG
jgi:hypothetical protein